MKARIAHGIAHFAARRIAGRVMPRFGLLQLLPGGLVPMLLAEGLLLALREVRKRPELRQKLWKSISAGMSRRPSAR